MALYSLGGFIVEAEAQTVHQIINKYYLSGTLPDGIIFVDLDRVLTGHPRSNELLKLIKSNPKIVAINNEPLAQKLGIKYHQLPCEVIDGESVEPVANTLDFNQFLYNAAVISKIIRDNHIKTGPGRGSSCYCRQLYNIGLTKIDPDQFHLHDSRFWGHNKSKFDIDLDVSPASRQPIIDAVNTGDYGFYLMKTINKNGDVHQSTYAMVDRDNIANGNAVLGMSNNMDVVVRKFSNVPCLDLLSLHIIDQLVNTDWNSISKLIVTKPLRKDVFQIGENDIAMSLWNPPHTILDIAFINALIRRKTYDNIGQKFNIDIVDNILTDTYGVIVYQDQITKLISTITGVDLYVAEGMRKGLNDEQILNMIKILRSRGYNSNAVLEFAKEIKDATQAPLICQGHAVAYACIIASDTEYSRK
jgi:hypothetical protein